MDDRHRKINKIEFRSYIDMRKKVYNCEFIRWEWGNSNWDRQYSIVHKTSGWLLSKGNTVELFLFLTMNIKLVLKYQYYSPFLMSEDEYRNSIRNNTCGYIWENSYRRRTHYRYIIIWFHTNMIINSWYVLFINLLVKGSVSYVMTPNTLKCQDIPTMTQTRNFIIYVRIYQRKKMYLIS